MIDRGEEKGEKKRGENELNQSVGEFTTGSECIVIRRSESRLNKIETCIGSPTRGSQDPRTVSVDISHAKAKMAKNVPKFLTHINYSKKLIFRQPGVHVATIV